MTHTYKLIFSTTLIFGTMISISSSSWLGMWMGLEINLISFIPLMNKKNEFFSSESSIKYFLTQAMASMMFLSTILISLLKMNLNPEFLMNKFIFLIMNSAILTKMGAAPFHFWLPEMIEGISWMNSLILLTWQKIAPMIIISYSMKMTKFMIMIVILSSLIGAIGGLNQTKLRKIMAFSSINHISWMIASLMINELIWMIYFLIYSFSSLILTLMFNNFKIFFLTQMFNIMSKKKLIKFCISMNLLSLGGLPPFLGFLPKWIIIQEMLSNKLMLFMMILMTLITLYFYLRIIFLD